MDQKVAVCRALDSAVARTAKSEFYRVTEGMSVAEKLAWVARARDSLNLLRSLESPDYSDWMVAILYVVRYQLTHVNLAYSMIGSKGEQAGSHPALASTGKLHIVDFGCGALAMQFGVALAVADALKQGQAITEVRIDSVDTSKPMIAPGSRIWEEFRDTVSRDIRFRALDAACDLIQEHYTTHADYRSVQKMPDTDSWISAMHVIYQSNRHEIQAALSGLHKAIRPDTAFITCYGDSGNPGNIPIVNRISPFGREYRRFELPSSLIVPRFPRMLDNSLIAKVAGEWGYFPPGRTRSYCDWPERTTAFIYSDSRRGDAEQISSVFGFFRRLFRLVAGGDS